jgi:hypothetical protein
LTRSVDSQFHPGPAACGLAAQSRQTQALHIAAAGHFTSSEFVFNYFLLI